MPARKNSITLVLILIVAAACLLLPASHARTPDDNPAKRWEKDIQRFEAWDAQNAWPQAPILFAGSSTIRMWQTRDAFPDLPVINRGFGGSQIPEVNYYLDRVVLKYAPSVIVFYCGDNDVASGSAPEKVLNDYKTFVARVHTALPKTQIIFLTIKPSGSRWHLWPTMNEANNLIRQFTETNERLHFVDLAQCLLKNGQPDDALFLPDRLHLNPAGYDRWNERLAPILQKTIEKKLTCPLHNPDGPSIATP